LKGNEVTVTNNKRSQNNGASAEIRTLKLLIMKF